MDDKGKAAGPHPNLPPEGEGVKAARRVSPVTRHLQRMAAAEAAARADAPQQMPSAASHARELMLAQLYEHTKTLKGFQSVEKKIAAKAEMVLVYDDYIDGVLKAGQGEDDPIVTTLLVWNIDAGRYDRALQIAAYVLARGLKLPDQYQRDVPTLLLDEFSEAAIAGKLAGEQALKILSALGALTEGHDAPDQANAKFWKALGWATMGKTRTVEVDPKELALEPCQHARTYLTRALELDANVGVKKDVERLQRRIEQLGGDAGAPN